MTQKLSIIKLIYECTNKIHSTRSKISRSTSPSKLKTIYLNHIHLPNIQSPSPSLPSTIPFLHSSFFLQNSPNKIPKLPNPNLLFFSAFFYIRLKQKIINFGNLGNWEKWWKIGFEMMDLDKVFRGFGRMERRKKMDFWNKVRVVMGFGEKDWMKIRMVWRLLRSGFGMEVKKDFE